MARIAPSILSADFAWLARDIRSIEESGGDWVHFDVMDGIFVPNISIGIPVLQSVRKITRLPLDVHLMIDRPIRLADRFVKAGADWLCIHAESDTEENTLACLRRIRALGCKSALALKPGTPAQAAEPFLRDCDMILVMTVEPGFGGQEFMADMMLKLRQLRHMLDRENPGCLLEVDGGVNDRTQAICTAHGAQVLVAGSAFFRAPDRKAFVRLIREEP